MLRLYTTGRIWYTLWKIGVDFMAHKIAEAIIEKGRIKSVSRKLPQGKMKVHLIYDVGDGKVSDQEVSRIIEETSGIYRDIDVEAEGRKLRADWERNAHD